MMYIHYICIYIYMYRASLAAQLVKILPAMWETWVGKIPWRRAWQPTPVFLPGESHGQRSLAGYSLWDHNKSDTTEWPSSWCMYTTGCKIASRDLVYSTGSSTWYSGDLERWEGGRVGGRLEREAICVHTYSWFTLLYGRNNIVNNYIPRILRKNELGYTQHPG